MCFGPELLVGGAAAGAGTAAAVAAPTFAFTGPAFTVAAGLGTAAAPTTAALTGATAAGLGGAAASAFSFGNIYRGLSAVADIFGSGYDSTADDYAYQAAIARNNAIIAQQDAEDARRRADVQAEEHRRRVRQTKGAARAVLAANGLLVDDDEDSTSSLLQQDIVEAGELDILKLRDAGEREARRFTIEADNFTAQSRLLSSRSSAARSQASFDAFGTLLGAAGKVAAPLMKKTSRVDLRSPFLM